MPPAKRKMGAQASWKTRRQRVAVALQICDRISVETRAWGGGYALVGRDEGRDAQRGVSCADGPVRQAMDVDRCFLLT